MHESSPGWDKVSQRLAAECGGYLASHYNTGYPLGAIVEAPDMPVKKYRNENLEAQTIDDEVVDIVVMQDVFEHVFFPNLAIKEVARTLKPGGLLVMTVPLVNQMRQSRRRAELLNSGETRHLLEPEYHGNPLSPDGSLVTIDWGYDIASYLQAHSDLAVLTIHINNPDMGIEGDLCRGCRCGQEANRKFMKQSLLRIEQLGSARCKKSRKKCRVNGPTAVAHFLSNVTRSNLSTWPQLNS